MRRITALTLFALFGMLFGASTACAATTTNTFTTAGTGVWTAPAGVYLIAVEVWGGGGGGGSDRSSLANGGGGGGGSAFAKVNYFPVTPGTIYSYTVGAGGSAGTVAGALATAGGDSTFNISTCVAAGGSAGTNGDAGTGGVGGLANASTGDAGFVFSGGNGAAGNSTTGGGGGGSAGAEANGGNGGNPAAGGAGSGGGAAGGSGSSGSSIGNAGSAPGGGGGGAQRGGSTSYAGGAGAAGQVRITYVTPAVETFTTAGSSTWTAPAGARAITIEAWGGGGGGGTDSSSTTGGAGGGGGGAYAMIQSFAVTPGNSYSYTVGAGGGAATVGEASTFNGSTCVAAGGSGGTSADNGAGGAGGLANASTGDITYDGGSGSIGLPGSYGGGGGGSAGTGGAGHSATTATGAGAVTGGGPGGNAGGSANGSSPLSGPGGGGGGGGANNSSIRTGGAGYAGRIRISIIPNSPPAPGTHNLVTTVNTPLKVSASDLAAADYDANGDALSITAVSSTSTNGPDNNVSLAAGTITYAPATGFAGADQFTYTVSDGYGGTAMCTANVMVRLGQATSALNYISMPVNNRVDLRGYGIPGHAYEVQASNDLVNWAPITVVPGNPITAAPNGVVLATDPSANTSPRYYRFAVH